MFYVRLLVTSSLFLCVCALSARYAFEESIQFLNLAQVITAEAARPGLVVLGKQPSAEAWVVFDAETGEILADRNADAVLPIASVTKLFTAETALAGENFSATTTVSLKAITTEGFSGRLKAGESMSAQELLLPLLLESSNDAAEAIAEFYGRKAFIRAMNERVRGLGLSSTSFEDPSGLSPKNVSTAHELAEYTHYLYEHHPEVLDTTKLAYYINSSHQWKNNNPVRSFEDYEGGKHGFTDEADRTIVSLFEEEIDGEEKTVGYVLLHSDSYKDDVQILRDAVEKWGG